MVLAAETVTKYQKYDASEKGRARHARYRASEKGRINKILCHMRYNNKLADARDAAQLQSLKERRSENAQN